MNNCNSIFAYPYIMDGVLYIPYQNIECPVVMQELQTGELLKC